MKCDQCHKELRAERPIMIWETDARGVRLCQDCWHKAMHHRKDQVPPAKVVQTPERNTRSDAL